MFRLASGHDLKDVRAGARGATFGGGGGWWMVREKKSRVKRGEEVLRVGLLEFSLNPDKCEKRTRHTISSISKNNQLNLDAKMIFY
jgi:hypothetical protein